MIDSTVLKSEKKQTLKEKAALQIRKAIIQGDLKSGTRLVEQELSELLGISRLPIREALVSLAQRGLVTLIPYKGAFVSAFSMREIKEFFDVRELLELHAIKILIRRRNPEQIRTLYNVVETMHIGHGGELSQVVDYDYEFHGMLCKLSENQVLYDTWRGLSEKIQCCIAVELSQLSFEAIEQMHHKIVEVIEQGNFAAGERELKSHMAYACELALRHFDYPSTSS